MPGIVGVAGLDHINTKVFYDMVQSIKYESSYIVDNFIQEDLAAISRVHLGIINPEPQPIYNEDNSICIIFDGELYNTNSYKKDPEFCLHLYEIYGKSFAEKLNGSFTCVIYNIKNRKVVIVTDRYGMRPMYYMQNNGELLFASEVKAILQDKSVKTVVNDEAVVEFFTFGHLLGNKTLIKGINLVPPASILTWVGGKISIEQYWDFEYDEAHKKQSEEYYVEELVRLFKRAVDRRMDTTPKIAVSLSGGQDSRAVVSAINTKKYKFSTVTFSFPGIDETPKIVKNITERIGITNNRQFELKQDFLVDYGKKYVYFTDGMLNLTHSHQISFLKELKNYADIILYGWEPETTFKGEFIDRNILSSKDDDELSQKLLNKYSITSESDRMMLFDGDYYGRIKSAPSESIKKEIKKSKNILSPNKSDYFAFQNRERRAMPSFVVVRSILEDREPFRDNDLIDFSLKIPPELRYNRKIYIKFLKRLCPELSNIPTSPSGIWPNAPRILHKVYYYKMAGLRKICNILKIKTRGRINIPFKSDYPDYGEWIRTNKNLKAWVENILLDEKTLSRPYLNKDFIFDMVSDHMNYKKNYTQIIFALLTYELWYRLFIDGDDTI